MGFLRQSCRRNFLQLLHDFQDAVGSVSRPVAIPSLPKPEAPPAPAGAVSKSSSPSGLQGPKWCFLSLAVWCHAEFLKMLKHIQRRYEMP